MIDTEELLDEVDKIIFSDGPVELNSDGTVKADIVPGIDESSQAIDEFRGEVSGMVSEYYSLSEQINELNAKKKELGEKILRLVGTGVRMEFKDTSLVLTTVGASIKNRFDSSRFKNENPNEYFKYLKESRTKPYTKVIKKK